MSGIAGYWWLKNYVNKDDNDDDDDDDDPRNTEAW